MIPASIVFGIFALAHWYWWRCGDHCAVWSAVHAEPNSRLANACRRVALSLDMEMPAVYLDMNKRPFACCASGHRAWICVSDGMLKLLDDDELVACVAHEFGHLREHHSYWAVMLRALTFATLTIPGLGWMPALAASIAFEAWFARQREHAADYHAWLLRPAHVGSMILKIPGVEKRSLLGRHPTIEERLAGMFLVP